MTGESLSLIHISVGDPGGSPAPPGDLIGPVRHNVHPQNASGPGDDPGKFLRGVELQPQRHAETVPQGGRELARPGGGADEGKVGQVQTCLLYTSRRV